MLRDFIRKWFGGRPGMEEVLDGIGEGFVMLFHANGRRHFLAGKLNPGTTKTIEEMEELGKSIGRALYADMEMRNRKAKKGAVQ